VETKPINLKQATIHSETKTAATAMLDLVDSNHPIQTKTMEAKMHSLVS
jgi:hypothetical protein